MPCVRCVVSGRVQGVFYRGETRNMARRLGVTGWVRNLPDGRVEVMASGSASQLEALQQWLWQGPPAAQVVNVSCSPAAEQVFDGFFVQH